MEAPTISRHSKNDDARIKFIKNILPTVTAYALASRKTGAVLDATSNPMAKGRLLDIETLLSWLEESVDMNPTLKQKSNLPKILAVVYAKPEYHFPEELRIKAKGLFERWEAENWGAPLEPESQPGGGTDIDDGNETGSEEYEVGYSGATSTATIDRRTSSARVGNTRTHYPPLNHQIWGQTGIFRGLAKKENLDTGRVATVFNDRMLHLKKDPKIYGHNGLLVGQWFPSQLCALFNGAVGSSQGGISGHTANGAYSIVVSGAYEDLDTDNGEVLYYSGSGSHENTDPKNHKESTTGTRCLKASYYSGKPIRVMRSGPKGSVFCPSVGIRYDGLYKIVSMNRPRNNKGGLYEQFRLERLDDKSNGTLEECRKRPTNKEVRDFNEREVKYW